MSEWKEFRLTEVGYLKRGKSKHRPRYAHHLFGGKYPFIQTGEIKAASKYIKEYSQTYSEAGLAQSKLWPKGTLCITIAANIAEIAILDIDACFPDSVLGFIPDNSKCNLDYVFYSLTHYKRDLQAQAIGSVQDNINAGTFEDFKFPFPPLKEQSAIADVLSSLDDKIDLLHRQNKTLEQLAETLFRQWFVEEAKESWEKGKLGGVLSEIESGSRPKGGIDPELRTGVPSIGAENINGIGVYDFSKTKFITNEFYRLMRRGVIKNYDVLIYKDGAYVGRKGMYGNGFPYSEATVNEHVFILRGNERVNQFFLYFLLQQEELEQLNTNSAQPGLNQEAVKSFEVIIPPHDLISKYGEVVKPFIDKIFFNGTQIKTLTQLRDTLLPKLMSGEVRVKN